MSTPAQQNGLQALLSHPLVQQAQQQANVRLAGLDKELSKYQVANDFEARTKVPKAVAFIGFSATVVTLLFFNILGLARPISALLGWILPAYFSIKALDSPGPEDDRQWLTYWVVFTTLQGFEGVFIRPILYWVPFYFTIKSLAILWLQLPGTRGAEVLYRQVLHPRLQQRAAARSQQPAATKLD